MVKRKKDKTIFRVILLPLLSFLAAEIFLLMGMFWFGGVQNKLNPNAEDIVEERVENRRNYLLNEMNVNWSNLSLLSHEINEEVTNAMASGEFSLEHLNSDEQSYVNLLNRILPKLVDMMYNKQVSGAFVILNTDSPEYTKNLDMLPGIALRDMDPKAAPSEKYDDIMLERAPIGVVKSGYITADANWQPMFSKQDSTEQMFFFKPYTAAYSDDTNLDAKEYGYWTKKPYVLSGDNHSAISYSIPLILEDGTVYGVLGIELLTDYLQSLLPYHELLDEKQGTYMLAVAEEGQTQLSPVVLSSETLTSEQAGNLHLHMSSVEGDEVAEKEGRYSVTADELIIYNRNAPFDSDNWYLLGIADYDTLFAFPRQIQAILMVSWGITVLIGLFGSLFVSYRLSKPIRHLSKEVEKAKQDNRLPLLSRTGIQEIDQFAGAITHLEHEVVESSTRFLSIMDMASVELAGYEIREDEDSIFITDNYLQMFDIEDIEPGQLTVTEFKQIQQNFRGKYEYTETDDGSLIYTVPLAQGGLRYLRSEYKKKGSRYIGLVEDVTVSMTERLRIERERDCDALTRLYSRRGFRREADELFLNPYQLKTAALLMMDLDNLKTTNDTFGHQFGDKYIQTAGQCFM